MKHAYVKIFLAAAAAVLSMSALPAAAAPEVTVEGTVDFGQGGARIVLQGSPEQSPAGRQFRIYRLFQTENSAGGESVRYEVNPDCRRALQRAAAALTGTEQEPDSVTDRQILEVFRSFGEEGAQDASGFRMFVEKVRDELADSQAESTMISVESTEENQQAVISGLPFGYYLIDEVTDVAGTGGTASLCMADTAGPEALIRLKDEAPPGVEKTILEDDGEIGWNAVGDYEIGQTVPFRYTAPVPDMSRYQTYYYAFHDRMDDALTFDSRSVEIRISLEDEEYVLLPEEYSLEENTDGDTFAVVIPDLKAVAEREFGNSDGGQTVTVRYNARLNENAALDTGRPGFENRVSLEFSNNPDGGGERSTGRTPWDTVVCFTYRLEGVKLNEKDRKLEGAAFRLYSDEACTEEVYVTENGNGSGYVVVNRDSLGGSDHTGGSAPENSRKILSDENGVFTVYGLDSGTYYLKEVSAPAGYALPEAPVRLTVSAEFTEERGDYLEGSGATDAVLKKLTASAEFPGEGERQLDADASGGAVELTAVNRTGSRLPSTGSAAGLIFSGSGAALMGTALALRTKKAGRRRRR